MRLGRGNQTICTVTSVTYFFSAIGSILMYEMMQRWRQKQNESSQKMPTGALHTSGRADRPPAQIDSFTFSFQKFESLVGEKLEVLRIRQQHESLKFMAHFKRKFVIRQGTRKEEASPIHCECSLHRPIQINPNAAALNSAFTYILKLLFDNEE